jgi:hypothetical protein
MIETMRTASPSEKDRRNHFATFHEWLRVFGMVEYARRKIGQIVPVNQEIWLYEN